MILGIELPLWLWLSQHIDTGKNTKSLVVSQHTDTSENTKATLQCYVRLSYVGTIIICDKLLP